MPDPGKRVDEPVVHKVGYEILKNSSEIISEKLYTDDDQDSPGKYQDYFTRKIHYYFSIIFLK